MKEEWNKKNGIRRKEESKNDENIPKVSSFLPFSLLLLSFSKPKDKILFWLVFSEKY